VKHTPWFLFLVMLLCGCTAITVVAPPPRQFIDSSQNVSLAVGSTVALVKESRMGVMRAFCTGFYISRNQIATAAHCLATSIPAIPAMRVSGVVGNRVLFHTYSQYRLNNNHRTPTNEAIITHISVDNDVALLSTTHASDKFFTISTDVPRVGSTVYSVGSPGGMPWMLSQGIVSQVAWLDTHVPEFFYASPPIFFGSSGGPLLNSNGRVIGITMAVAFEQSTFGIFTPIQRLVNLVPAIAPPTPSH